MATIQLPNPTIEDSKIQQTADNLHIPIYQTPDGKLYQLKPGNIPPPGAKIFQPSKPWPAPFVGIYNSREESTA